MVESSTNSKTIANNDIKNFILRIDFQNELPVNDLIETLKSDFSRVEERQVIGFQVEVKFPQNSSEISKKNFTDIILVREPNLSLTLSAKDNSLIITSTSYLDNSLYKDLCSKIIDLCQTIDNCVAKRIGLRYINEIPCPKIAHISRIFKSKFSSVIKNMTATDDTSRAIAVQIRNCGDTSLKIQYGVPNKFFPALITNYDLLLDIDSFTAIPTPSADWENIISTLNHKAYDAFTAMINESYIEGKKNA